MTLAISPFSNYDPINPIKLLITCSISFCCMALIIGNFRHFLTQELRPLIYSISIFIFGLILSFVFSKAPWAQQLWGSFGRNNGLLNYAAICFIALGAAAVADLNFYYKLLKYLSWTSIPMVIYCFFQIAGLDPFPWSSFQPFGTLGNVNFLSAFLGMAAISSLLFCIKANFRLASRLFYLILVLSSLYIIQKTDSIQGLIIFAIGASILFFFYVKKFASKFTPIYVFGLTLIGGLSFLALFNFGPFSKFIYQQTIVFRSEYMLAGLKMFQQHFLFGVGIDSYGDWYALNRGIMATFRTGINRTSNSAHNVFIDVAAGSGIIAIVGFILIHLVVISRVISFLRKNEDSDFVFVTLVAIWIAYTVQSSISINQIGIGIWGWLIAGSIIGMSYCKNAQNSIQMMGKKPKKLNKNVLSASNSLVAFVGFSIGFLITFLPLKVDADYRKFANAGDLLKMMETVSRAPSSAVLIGQTQIAATRSSYHTQAKELNDLLISKFPRDFFGWQSRAVMDSVSDQEKTLARLKIKELDPFFYCFEPNASQRIKSSLSSLPSRSQWELAKFWQWSSAGQMPLNFKLEEFFPEKLDERVNSYCNL